MARAGANELSLSIFQPALTPRPLPCESFSTRVARVIVSAMDGPAECTEQQKMLGELTEALGDAEISYSNLKLAIQESECAHKYLKRV